MNEIQTQECQTLFSRSIIHLFVVLNLNQITKKIKGIFERVIILKNLKIVQHPTANKSMSETGGNLSPNGPKKVQNDT